MDTGSTRRATSLSIPATRVRAARCDLGAGLRLLVHCSLPERHGRPDLRRVHMGTALCCSRTGRPGANLVCRTSTLSSIAPAARARHPRSLRDSQATSIAWEYLIESPSRRPARSSTDPQIGGPLVPCAAPVLVVKPWSVRPIQPVTCRRTSRRLDLPRLDIQIARWTRHRESLALALIAFAGRLRRNRGPPVARLPADHAARVCSISRLLRTASRIRAGWARTSTRPSLRSISAPHPQHLRAAVARDAQDSGFQVDPVVPGWRGIARKEIDKRPIAPAFPVSPWTRAGDFPRHGKSYGDDCRPPTEASTEARSTGFLRPGAVRKTFLFRSQPDPRAPMQVSIAFAVAFAARLTLLPYSGTIRQECSLAAAACISDRSPPRLSGALCSALLYRFAISTRGMRAAIGIHNAAPNCPGSAKARWRSPPYDHDNPLASR